MARRGLGGFVLYFLVLVSSVRSGWAWGEEGHRLVNGVAVESLPEPLRTYFRMRKAYLIENASQPDWLARDNPAERAHHYTDSDADEAYPFARLREQFVDEGRGPTSRQLRNGDLIWQIERYTRELEKDFRGRRWSEVDRAAVFLAHYACDLTQPLHTLVNYDGQLTRQAGVHARFETDLVRAIELNWTPQVEPAVFEPNVRARIFQELRESYRESPLIFAADRSAASGRSYLDPDYFPAFVRMVGPLGRKRLEAAVRLVASLWYTAWVRAGKPELPPGEASR